MHSETAFVLTVLVLCYAAVSGLIRRWYLAPALIFVSLGVVLGPSCLSLIEARSDTKAFTVLAELALTVILFNQASTLNLRKVFRRGHLPMRLTAIGIPVTLALNTVIAISVLPVLPFWEAVCLGAIVAPTEVAMVDALLEDRRIPQRVRHALSIESGLYDGFALAALLAALALASEQTDPAPVRWAWFAFRTEFASLAIGVLIGVIGGVVISRSSARGWMSGAWAQLATLALALVCFELGERLHGSGFVTAFAGGLAYAIVWRRSGTQAAATQVSDAVGQLLELLVFALFGLVAVVPAWRGAGWRVVVFAVLALIVVRIASLAIALAGSGLPRRSKLFMGWFGPRGIGTLVLGLIVIEEGKIQQGTVITQAVVVIVTLSLILHSITAAPGIRLCQQEDDTPGDGPNVESSKGASPRRSGESDTMTRCPHPTVPPTEQGPACIN